MNNFGGVSVDEITVQIANKTGHATMVMAPAAAAVEVRNQARAGAWVFADGQLLADAKQLGESDLADVASLRVVPGLVGG
jgi:hypothetical protein